MKTFLILYFSTVAHAGWFSDFCEKHLIADDPSEFNLASDDWLNKEISQLEIKSTWQKASVRDARQLAIMKNERAMRDRLGYDVPVYGEFKPREQK